MDYELTDSQKRFVKKCERADLKVYYSYSGRGMYGRQCPAVNLDHLSKFPSNPNKYSVDQMGLGWVVYCPK
jgi:hypothetical protein